MGDGVIVKDIESFENLLEDIKQAQKIFSTYTQEQVEQKAVTGQVCYVECISVGQTRRVFPLR